MACSGRLTILIAICIALFTGAAQAQIISLNDTTSTPIEGAGHDYIHMLSETVNPANGSLSLRIQIPVPKGRGLTIPFSFDYDSGSVHHLNGAEWFSNTSYLAQGGWSYSIPTISASFTDVQVIAGYGNGAGWPPQQGMFDCLTYSNYMFQDPSGGQHALGLATQGWDSAPNSCPSSGSSTSVGGDAQVRAWLPNTHPDPTWNPMATPYLPVTVSTADGTIYNFPAFNGGTDPGGVYIGLPNSIEDRNGNVISVSNVQNGQFTFTDSAGRTMLQSSGFGTSGNTISILGQNYTINWTTVSASFTPPFNWIPDFPGHQSENNGCNPIGNVNDTSKVISSIVLPNGQQYQFHYGNDNSDPTFHNSYGLLNEIDYPSGAWAKYKWTIGNINEFADYPGVSNTLCPGTDVFCPTPVPDGCLIQYAVPVVAERDLGTTIGAQPVETQKFTFTTAWDANGTTASTQWTSKFTSVQTIDDITGNSTTTGYSYSAINVPRDPIFKVNYWSQIPVEQKVTTYNFDGSFLREEDKTWFDQFNLATDKTTLNNPTNGPVSETTYCYGIEPQCQPSTSYFSQVTEKDEYGFGQGTPGPVIRKTLTSYDNLTTPIKGMIAHAPSSVIVQDSGGNRVAETDYTYDETTTSSVAAVQHDGMSFPNGPGSPQGPPRGNLTTKTEKCFPSPSTCQDAITKYAYDETGQVTSITDPNGNQTQYSYADPNNTNAYLTQVTRPPTNGVNHIENFTYDYTSGQLLTATDENGLTNSYQYNDPFFRPTLVSSPDGGRTTISYNDVPPNPKVTTTQLITSSLPITHTTIMDGLGRVIQTQLNTDPEGTTYVDTTYDGMGNHHTVSNPYRSTSDPSYGITTYNYDADGRVLQITDADGSVATTSYVGTCTPDNYSSDGYAELTTTTDEAGSVRASCTDALGRLVEVNEPGQGANTPATASTGSFTISGSERSTQVGSATAGAGSVTISGSEQSWQTQTAPATQSTGYVMMSGVLQSTQVQTQAGTSGRATITINGAEQSVYSDPCAQAGYGSCPNTIYDSGHFSVIVNGFTATAGYGSNDTPNSVANSLAGALNSGSSPVTASASGNVVTLTAKTTGAATNYSLSLGATVYDSHDFYQSSFVPWRSGSTLTGGTDAVYTTVYDSGTTTITINGQPISYSWSGSGTSANSIVSNLASLISSNSSYVTASASGAELNLTSRSTGASTNYSCSGNTTYDHSHFSQASFGEGCAAMTGGADPQYTTNYDSGTSSITANGHSTSYNWSGASTSSSSIASGLAQAINNDGSASVNASASSATVNLTARSAGPSSNYSLSASSSSSHNSFSSSSSGGSLTGGAAAPIAYDTGTVSLTINGTTIQSSYNSSSSAASIASDLESKLPPALITGSGSGTTINLTTMQTGSATGYPLSSGSSTSQPGTFSGPSFSISLSGSNMSGGTDSKPGPFSINSPAVTLYSYDTLGNMTCAVQKGQDTTPFTSCASASSTWRPRSFTYNSLSQLLSATNPESGTIQYAYDANGNLSSKTDARGITTKYQYDALNRVYSKNYQNDSTGTVGATYGYDGVAGAGGCAPALSASNPVGKRTSMCDAAGKESWSYQLNVGTGWETIDQRTTNGVTYTLPTQFNLDGSVASVTYPDTVALNYIPGGAGRPLGATAPEAGITFVSNATYAPFGGLTGALYNGSMTVSNSYNHRMQPVFLSASGGAGTIYSLGYDFHWANGDNGNVFAITNNKDNNRSQNFTYDALNRIQTAYTSGPNWGEQYTTDTWGNLVARDPVGGKTMYEPLSVGRQATAQNQFSGSFNYFYDADGNMIQNGGAHYTYDAEDRLMSAGGVNYTYDGDGNRVMKSSGTIYWGGGESGALAETDLSGNIQHEYVFFNGKRQARVDLSDDTMHFYFADHLGSTSDVTDAVGNIQYESDYYPYGGEMPVITGDSNHYKFNGKERDTESGLDEFGARYYASSLGRFTIPDWAAKPTAVPYAHYGNPQSLNLYGYVQNNPTTFGDPDGHEIIYADNLQNAQEVKDSVQAILADPNTSANLSGYVGKESPNLTIQSGDLSKGDTTTKNSDGRVTKTTVQADTVPDIQTGTFTDSDGTLHSDTKFYGATTTIDNRTSKGDLPGVMVHESVHAGEAMADPAKFAKDNKAEQPLPYNQRPQEQRAFGAQKAYGNEIKKAVKKIEKDRKKDNGHK